MRHWNWANSLVTRLVISFCVGGLALSAVLTVLEYRHASSVAGAAASQQLAMTVHNLKEATAPLIAGGDTHAIENVLDIFGQDQRIVAVRLEAPTTGPVTIGDWPADLSTAAEWTFDEQGLASVGSLDLNRYTLVTAPFHGADGRATLRIVVDGPYLREQVRESATRNIATVWLLLAVLTLVGLLLLRWWFTGPLTRMIDLIAGNAPAEAFEQMAGDTRGELGELSSAIGGMLGRIDRMTGEIRRREMALDNLYQFAPGALLSIGPDGRVLEANRRAVALFDLPDERALIGTPVLEYVHPKDRSSLRRVIDRLSLDRSAKCGLQMSVHGRIHDIEVELAGVFNEQDALARVRMSLVDISETKRLLRQVSEQRQLLDLVIDRMSDGILLVGPDRRILAANARLCRMLNVHPEALIEQPYDPVDLWSSLEIIDTVMFAKRMSRAASRPSDNCQEQFDGSGGSYRFLAIPVNDSAGETVAQLYVLQDVTAEARNRRLLEQQDAQLRALQRMGEQLHRVRGVDDLIERTTRELLEVMGVEVVGTAIRGGDPKQRCRLLIHDGSSRSALGPTGAAAEAVGRHLMPKVLAQRDTSCWPDLGQAGDWAAPLRQLGIESLASTALCSRDRTQGILWIGRRGGERIERHHIYLLETLAPMVSTALQNAELRDQMDLLALTDPITGLPSFRQYSTVARHVRRRGGAWAVLVVDLDHFQAINASHGMHAADSALRQIADVLRDCCRATDQSIRHSEDKFIVLCPATDLASASPLAERIRRRVAAAELALADQRVMRVTASIGVSACPDDGDDADLLLDVATKRMRQAKAGGRDRVVLGDGRVAEVG